MFDNINKILYKTKAQTQIDESEFQPFLIQRWCSMYSPQVATLLNQTSNRIWSSFTDKEHWFQYLHGIIPPCRFKRFSYIKKKKDTENNAKSKEAVAKIASNLEISSREVNLYVQEYNLDLPHEKKSN